MKELSEHAKSKLAKIEALRADGKTLGQAMKETHTSAGAYYQWKKVAKKTKRKRIGGGPVLQTIPVPSATIAQRLVCVIGSVADIRELIGGLT